MVRRIALQALKRLLDSGSGWCRGALEAGIGGHHASRWHAADSDTRRRTLPILEPSVINHLKQRARQRGGNLIGFVAGFFRSDALSRVAAMKNALHAGDAEALSRAAHTLTWTSANIGAGELAECCRRLEQTVVDRGLDANLAWPLVLRIEALVPDVLAVLDLELRDNAA
jgi:HPt (histidine-containing phosphotransfer) domain-containing protein